LANTLRGIRLYSKCKNAEEFATAFEPALTKALERYKAAGKPLKDLSQKIERLERGEGTMSYVMLSAYAEYLDIPTGLLILYSHAVGHASHGKSKEMITILKRSIAALKTLAEIVERSDEKNSELVLPHDKGSLDDGRYVVRAEPLGKVLGAYKEKP